MNIADFFAAASEAVALLIARPLRWLAVVLIFLVAVEVPMFIPYIGFVIKIAAAGIITGGIFDMFVKAAGGARPGVLDWSSAFTLPVSAQAVLAAGSLFPFVIGIAYLYVEGGASATHFFFGNIFKDRPPPPELFLRFKYVMDVVTFPLTLLTGAVVLKRLSGFRALFAALAATLANWLPLVFLSLFDVAFDWLSAQLPLILPGMLAAAAGGALLVIYVGWSFAVLYSVSARAFAISSPALPA